MVKSQGPVIGGDRGIRTLDRVLAYTPLAGVRLQPLGQLSKGFSGMRWGIHRRGIIPQLLRNQSHTRVEARIIPRLSQEAERPRECECRFPRGVPRRPWEH